MPSEWASIAAAMTIVLTACPASDTGREELANDNPTDRDGRYVVLETTTEIADREMKQIINQWEQQSYRLHMVIPKSNVWGFVIVMDKDRTTGATPEERR